MFNNQGRQNIFPRRVAGGRGEEETLLLLILFSVKWKRGGGGGALATTACSPSLLIKNEGYRARVLVISTKWKIYACFWQVMPLVW